MPLSCICIRGSIYNIPLMFQCAIQTLYACTSSSSYLLARILGLGIRQGTMDGACNHAGHECEHMQKRSELRWIFGAYSFAIQMGEESAPWVHWEVIVGTT